MMSGPRTEARYSMIAAPIRLTMRIAAASWRLVTQPDRIGCGAYSART